MLKTKSAAALAGVTSDHVLTRTDDQLVVDLLRIVTNTSNDSNIFVRNVPGRLQEGVTCGLVCLAMAADYVKTQPTTAPPTHNSNVINNNNNCDETKHFLPIASTVDAISSTSSSTTTTISTTTPFSVLLRSAIDAGYSSAGEMFCAHQLAKLARDQLCISASATTTHWTVDSVALHIARGGICLVAYDCAKNFEPFECLGAKSHWCVVIGYRSAMMETDGAYIDDDDSGGVAQQSRHTVTVWARDQTRDSVHENGDAVVVSNTDTHNKNLHTTTSTTTPTTIDAVVVNTDTQNNNLHTSTTITTTPPTTTTALSVVDYFVCVQPKSRRVALWRADALRRSNAQLQRSDEFGKDNLDGRLRYGVVWIK